MRFSDMNVGEQYRTTADTTVTLLDTPDEVRARHRARVRFEDGMLRGQQRDLWIGRLRPLVEPPPAEPVRPPEPETKIVVTRRPPRPGDQVRLEGLTGDLLWTVEEIGHGTAVVTTTVIETSLRRDVPLDALMVCEERRPTIALDSVRAPAPAPPAATPSPLSVPEPADEPPGTPVERLERLLFTPACLAEAGRRLGIRGDVAAALRKEVARDGRIIRKPGEYCRLRVPGRFDIVLAERPDEHQLTDVDRLRYPPRQSRRPRPKPRGNGRPGVR